MKHEFKLVREYGGGYREENREFSMCLSGFDEYIVDPKADELFLVISTTKPRHAQYYTLRQMRGDGNCYDLQDDLLYGMNTSPWTYSTDYALKAAGVPIDRTTDVYVWFEYES